MHESSSLSGTFYRRDDLWCDIQCRPTVDIIPGTLKWYRKPRWSNGKWTQSDSWSMRRGSALPHLYLRAVLLRSPDGHLPCRHTAHPHPSKMTIHLTQPRVMRTPHRASPTCRFPRRENPSGRITRREPSHMTIQSHLALVYHASELTVAKSTSTIMMLMLVVWRPDEWFLYGVPLSSNRFLDGQFQ